MSKDFMIAATGSGCGKTTITCALLGAIQELGYSVRSFKCGPDYIDPMFHTKVLGIPSRNLDLFFTDEKGVRALYERDASKYEVSVVEGVMGLYDGMHPSSPQASSYDLARSLDLPILLVVDCKGMGRSLLSVIKGFLADDLDGRIGGVFLNRISPNYYETIAPIITKELSLPVLGYLPVLKDYDCQSRYLGLKLPEEIPGIRWKFQDLSRKLMEYTDVSRMLNILEAHSDKKGKESLESKEILESKEVPFVNPSFPPVLIGVARDEAFCFYYEDNLRLLEEAGAKLVEFSPLRDDKLPSGISGLLLGGGYPELHASALASNTSMKQEIFSLLQQGLPSLAECGGYMYLHEAMEDEHGESYPMVSILPGKCVNRGKLVRFGYVTLEEKEKRFLTAGEHSCMKGHEFHYYDDTIPGEDVLSTKPVTLKSWSSSYVNENHWWGWTHLYYPSNPEFVTAFIQACRRWRDGEFS
ncbi:MAG: cobyrinate a,c-diamide synthase [Lachnospiraceae bacterium]|nr:cobyrinate a,c-diamide synthase [Lachnospiraceae bacterium]